MNHHTLTSHRLTSRRARQTLRRSHSIITKFRPGTSRIVDRTVNTSVRLPVARSLLTISRNGHLKLHGYRHFRRAIRNRLVQMVTTHIIRARRRLPTLTQQGGHRPHTHHVDQLLGHPCRIFRNLVRMATSTHNISTKHHRYDRNGVFTRIVSARNRQGVNPLIANRGLSPFPHDLLLRHTITIAVIRRNTRRQRN